MALEPFPMIQVAALTSDSDDLIAACFGNEISAIVFEHDGVPWDVDELVGSLESIAGSPRLIGTRPHDLKRHQAREGVTCLARTAPGTEFVAALTNTNEAIEDQFERPSRRSGNLTERELQVLAMIGMGLTTAQMGERLGISTKTIENRRQSLFAKLGVQNQSHAIATAMQAGLLGGVSGPQSQLTSTIPQGKRRGGFYSRPSIRVTRFASGLPKLLVVYDCVVVVDALRDLLAEQVDVVAATVSGRAAVGLSELHVPDVVIVGEVVSDGVADYFLPALLQTGARILLIADQYDLSRLLDFVEGGVSGIIEVTQSLEDLARAILVLSGGGAAFPPEVVASVAVEWRRERRKNRNAMHGTDLTDREIEVLGAMSDGLSTKAIAHHLGIAVKTVENHKTRIFDKLGVRTQAQAVALILGNAAATDWPDKGAHDSLRTSGVVGG